MISHNQPGEYKSPVLQIYLKQILHIVPDIS